MRTTNRNGLMAMMACGLLGWATALPATAQDLGQMLRDAGWTGIIGTWVDKDTKGERIRVTWEWKFEGKVMEVNTRTADRKSVALIGVKPTTGEVYHVGADNQGGGAIGGWDEDGGDAVLELAYASGDGQEGTMTLRHHMVDQNTMEVTIEADEPMTITLVREAGKKSE